MVFGMMNAFAQTVSVDDVTIKAGETKVVSINLNNTQTNIVSFQMDLTLPDGITINKAGCSLGNRIADYDQQLTIGKQSDGSIRLTSTSFALRPITDTSGEVVKLSLTAASNAKGGTASIKNIILATSNSESLTADNTTFKVTVTYALTYILDGEVYRSENMAYGTAITPEPAPTKEGHTFSGWSEIPETMPNHDVTVTGSFTINSYTLTYKVDGQVYKTSTVVYGTAITPEAEPTKEGYTFSGWNGLPETMPANDVVVTGSFTINSYNLTYIVDGEVYKTESIVYGTSIEPEPALKKTGYTFSGWSEIPETMPAHDVTVTGSFTINKYKLTYIVDGVEYKSYEIDYASAITPEAVPTKEGHTFSGWSDIPATMPAHDVTVTGSFSINSYKLTYLLNGEEYLTETVVYGTPLTPEPAVKREGYTFSGWSGLPETMPAHDVTVTGTLTVNNYKLTYKVDGAVYKTLTVAYGSAITPEPDPTKEGHTFSGWSEIPATMPAHDVEVTGSFSINSYTLTYVLDGSVYKTESVVYGTPLTPEPALQKEGYTFSGWSAMPITMPAHDVEVTGSFSINSYKLTYKVDGVVYKTSTVIYGTAITPEAEPSKEGYTFSGWSAIPETMPAHDVEVTGTFTVNSYTLTYMLDGKEYKTSTVAYGTPITPEANPTKEGYTFSGWSEIPAKMPAHDVVVTGSFSINSYNLTYKVDGVVYKTSTVVYGTAIAPEEEPVKEGHTFSGWSEIPKTMPAHDVTITGSFTINSYTLTYMVDGEVYKTERVTYGTALTPEKEPTKVGYTFSGWSEIPETMPAIDVTVTGSFSINSYTLTYMLDGEVYKTESVVYGTPLEEEPTPAKEGYTFSGWSAIPETMPARDVTVTGSFSINSYKLTYILDGEVYKTESIAYGTEITPEPALTKEGYTFSGWSEIPETMPAHDVTVTGSFSINSYILAYLVDGEEYLTLTLDYGTAITPEEEPTREGYTFSGWSKIPETMPAHDVVVTGTFTINQYILAYILDGEEYMSYKLDYNTPIKPEVMPVKRGMTFSGWGEVPEKMPAHDVTLAGSYSWSRETYDYVIYQVADTLNNYASVVGYNGTDEEVEILQEVIIGEDAYTVHGIAEDALPETVTICVPVGKLLLWLWEDGYDNLQETGSGRSLAAPELSLVGATSSSLSMRFTNEIAGLGETVTLLGKPVEKGEEGYDLTLRGLEPDNLYEGIATFTLTYEDVAYTKTYSFRTEALTLTTQQPKVVSLGNVIVAAESNLDDEETNVGFEWRRTDWTEDFTSNSGEAYLYEGMMEGYIHNLNTEKLWKYRPYYESNAGNRYYGSWVGIDPTNISYFEPTVHTYSSVTVTGNSVEVKGYAMQGTDNVASQGFMYWSTNSPTSRRKVNGIPDNAKTVLVNGYVMTVVLEGLEFETEYCCVAFVKTTEGETFYGEPQIFRTGPADPDGIEEVKNEELRMKDEGVWYSLDGKKLSKPQKGINIIRYSDGTSRKVLIN